MNVHISVTSTHLLSRRWTCKPWCVTQPIRYATLDIYRCGACPNIFSRVLHSYRASAAPLNTAMIEERHHPTCMYFPDNRSCQTNLCCFSSYSSHWMIRKHRFNDYVKRLLTGWLIYLYEKKKWWNSLVSHLNDALLCRKEDLSAVWASKKNQAH